MRSPRVGRIHSPCRSAASLLRNVSAAPKKTMPTTSGTRTRHRMTLATRHLIDPRQLLPFFEAARNDAVLRVARADTYLDPLARSEGRERFFASQVERDARRDQTIGPRFTADEHARGQPG